MSNIIKGVDFGMGYEQATKWEPGLKFWLGEWVKSNNTEREGLSASYLYRRKLPILTNHPEAIPLEPGEVLQVGDRGLTRDGRDTGELLPVGGGRSDVGCPLWSKVLNNSYSPSGQFSISVPNGPRDIIARLPKVAKEAETDYTMSEKEEGDKCRHTECPGKYGYAPVYGCSCHTMPPCGACTSNPLVCLVCNDNPEDMFEPRMKPEAEKAKEEKVEEVLIEVNNAKVGFVAEKPLATRVTKVEIRLSEAARLYLENESVRAEVKRQEEAKRIGLGDWAVEKASRTVFCVADVITDDDGDDFLIGFPDSDDDHCEFCASECTKVENPDLIAALNAEIDAKAGG